MPAWLPVILTFIAAVSSSWLVFVQADRKRRQDAGQASRDDVRAAYAAAERLYRSGISEAERQIDGLGRRVATLEADLEAARVRETSLRRRVGRLEAELRRAGLELPNGSDVI